MQVGLSPEFQSAVEDLLSKVRAAKAGERLPLQHARGLLGQVQAGAFAKAVRENSLHVGAAFAIGLGLTACATAPRRPGFVAIYRWQVKPECQEAFVSAWTAEAERYRDRYGSLGSRLQRAEDGTYVATAFWESARAWSSVPRPLDLPAADAVLNRCIESKVEELHLSVASDVPLR